MTEPWPPLHPLPPEVPLPLPPTPTVPGVSPVPTIATSVPFDALAERRLVLLHGPVDDAVATARCAELMALDGASSRPITLFLHSPGGPVEAVVPLVDTMALLRARVDVTCTGQALGTAAVVLAAAAGTRSVTPHATVSLRCPPQAPRPGTADELRRAVDEHERLRASLAELVAARSSLSVDEVVAHLRTGPTWTAAEAVQLGLADAVAERSIR